MANAAPSLFPSMSYSELSYTGNGSNKNFVVNFGYLEEDDVTVYVGNTPVSYSWLNASTVQTDAAPANGAVVRLVRKTDIDAPKVDFNDGSTLTEADLDNEVKQLLYAIQELSDRVAFLETAFTNINVTNGNLPPVNNTNNGQVLVVVNGVWTLVSPATITAVTDVQVDAGVYKFQKKTATLTVLSTANVSAWTDYHVGGPCST